MTRIRKARLQEADELVELWKRFMEQQRGLGRADVGDMLPRMRGNARDIVKGYFSRSIRSRHGLVLVLEDYGVIQGYMLSRIQKNIPVFKEDYIGYISDLYIKEGYRGEGVSTKMWKITLDWFQSKGISDISIRVLAYNDLAYNVYRSWGFRDYLKELRIYLDHDP
ncbi:MAG: GNAT family N-acetyltransferase [Candidatus Thermoplasmatota archaeon]|nr:GNAT family N-acetyltransferase [Candidatus Thermoplasmatota archaeon]